MRVTAVILAAGASTRLGQPKQLVMFEGETLLERAVRTAAEAGCDRVIAIVPPGFTAPPPAQVVVNEHRDEGIASSIRLGVEHANGDAVLLMLCDQPNIASAHLRALIDTNAPIAATAHSGIIGVPALFAPRFADEFRALRGDRGARAVIEAHRGEVVGVAFEGAAYDIDTVDDLPR